MILTEEQQLFHDAMTNFFSEHASIGALRRLREESPTTGFDREVWADLVELGLSGIVVPEEHGGLNFGWLGLGAIAGASGRHLAPTPLLSHVVLAQEMLLNCGSTEQIAKHLPVLLSGEEVWTVAIDGDRYFHGGDDSVVEVSNTLSGRKVLVPEGATADRILLLVRRSDGRLGVFVLSAQAEGVHIKATRMMDGRQYANITIEKLDASAGEWLEGSSLERGWELTLNRAMVILAAEMVGSARELLERTVRFLSEREQFGVKLATFQALQHRCAKLYCELELAESAVLAALSAIDQRASEIAAQASLAKAMANDCLTLISSEAVQLHGGMGVTDEMDIGLFLKRSRVTNQLLGTSEWHRERFAGLAGF
jgi:alkylation response protein AidB-like acyl-CoA dehydrogenase